MKRVKSEEIVSPLVLIVHNDHRLGLGDLAQKYHTNIDAENIPRSRVKGLDSAKIDANRTEFGTNMLPKRKKRNPVLVYLSYMNNLFSMMLILAGILSLVVFILDTSNFTSLYVGIIFILVAFFNAFLEFYQELKSQEVLEGFQQMMERNTKVIRDGELQEIDVEQIVVGDLIVLKFGDTVPADARLIESVNMKIDMSSLTGESVPVERNSSISTLSADKAKCLLFKGAAVTSGAGKAVVIGVGDRTLIGAIMRMSMGELVEAGELGREIEVLIRRIVLGAGTTGLLFMGVAFIQGMGVIPAFETAIGIFVAFLPQGLPMTITILLTTAAKRMAKHNVLVKNLQAVETLGSLTVIATDKTGTLTLNQMEVVGGWINLTIYDDIMEGLAELGDLKNCFAGSNTVQMNFNEPINLESLSAVHGDATELGMFRFMLKINFDFHAYFQNNRRIHEIPFDSARKWNLAIIRSADGRLTVCLKGAPDRLIGYSNADEPFQASFREAYRHFASNGQRLIGFATKELSSEDELTEYQKDPSEVELHGFKFIGLLSVYDPPKEGVKEAVKQLRKSGIKVFMVTGDHPITAQAIARKVGIIEEAESLQLITQESLDNLVTAYSIVIHGDLLDSLTDEQWNTLLGAQEIVFARTLPRHKLAIVKQLQKLGEIVGSIGDGVNDSPAIKRANLGISMNKTGSDVSKDAASMILLDDRFASIVTGVFEGRLIYQDLKKSIRYTLSHIFPEVAAFSAWVLFLIPPPLTPILVLMIDVGSELGPALSYAYEPAEIDLLSLPPRKRLLPKRNDDGIKLWWWKRAWITLSAPFRLGQIGEALIDPELVRWVYLQGGLIETIGCFGAYILVYVVRSVPLSSLWRSTGIYFYDATKNLTLTNGQVINAAQQETIMQESQGAYYLAIIIGQLFNLFITKSRYKYPFRMAAFKNKATYIGGAAAVIIGALVVYVPGLQSVFNTTYVNALSLCSPLVTGLFLIIYEMCRHKLHRMGYFGGSIVTSSINS